MTTVGESVVDHIAANGGNLRDFFKPAPRGGWVFLPFHQFLTAGEYAHVRNHFEDAAQ